MSADAAREQRWAAVDTVAGLFLMVSIFASAIGLVWRPARLVPFAVVLALVAARMSPRHERLATLAVAAAVVGWTVGMALAVLTGNPLY